jgi:hypothetical protein
MIKKILTYLRFYMEPDGKAIRTMAFESAKLYYSRRKPTMTEFQAYQMGYVRAYRENYAKAKLRNIDLT